VNLHLTKQAPCQLTAFRRRRIRRTILRFRRPMPMTCDAGDTPALHPLPPLLYTRPGRTRRPTQRPRQHKKPAGPGWDPPV